MPTFIMGLLGAVALLALGIALHRFSGRRDRFEAQEKQELQKSIALRRLTEAGTHNENGDPLCVICRKHVATEGAFEIARSEDLAAWAKQSVGAPARLRVVQRDSPVKYCRFDVPLAHAEFQAFVIAFEQTRRSQVRDSEIELQHFEKIGADERVRSHVESHAKRMKKDGYREASNVVALRS